MPIQHYTWDNNEYQGVLLICLDCIQETLQELWARKGNSSLFQRKAE